MAKRRKKRKNRKKTGLLLVVLAILIGGGSYLYLNQDVQDELKKVTKIQPTLKIVDENSKRRPLAVMIDNSDAARGNHIGLQDAYITYEAITEGGITRLMALFKDVNTDLIGPVRSSRHYFLDYALENDAIYAHYGWSERAKNDISSLDINNLNGITNASDAYWRDQNFYAPHNVYTSIEKLKASAEAKSYALKTDTPLLLPYSVKPVHLETDENHLVANQVVIPYSYYHTTSYQYKEEEQRYYRSMNDEAHTDYKTKKQYHVKNILILKIHNYSFDSYGRQDLENIGTGDGYFITSGYAIPIQWHKNSRSKETTYTKMDGSELKVNDGNTAIHIQPITQETTIQE